MPIVLKAIFFTAAVVCFLMDAYWDGSRRDGPPWSGLLALGLTLFATPFAFDAWAAID